MPGAAPISPAAALKNLVFTVRAAESARECGGRRGNRGHGHEFQRAGAGTSLDLAGYAHQCDGIELDE